MTYANWMLNLRSAIAAMAIVASIVPFTASSASAASITSTQPYLHVVFTGKDQKPGFSAVDYKFAVNNTGASSASNVKLDTRWDNLNANMQCCDAHYGNQVINVPAGGFTVVVVHCTNTCKSASVTVEAGNYLLDPNHTYAYGT